MTTSKIYLVGGAVRDALMGLPERDRDFVVVGGDPQTMIDQGFVKVGQDFPVFLHPVTGDQYALARTERKSGKGYNGFAVYAGKDVTLIDDLARRDLTINAMARNENGTIIDPHGGQNDIAFKRLRHVSSKSFVEDPLRVLRVARFAARFSDFRIDDLTMLLMREMVTGGELNHLVAERVWQELAKGMMEVNPIRMFEVLRSCGALKVLIPELDALWGVPQRAEYHPEIDAGVHTMLVLEQAVLHKAPLEVRFACLVHDLGKGITPKEMLPRHHDHENTGLPLVKAVCDRLKVPADVRSMAMLVCEHHIRVHRALEVTPQSILKLLLRLDALRRPERFKGILSACMFDATGRLGFADKPYPEMDYLVQMYEAVNAVDASALVNLYGNTPTLVTKLHNARLGAVKAVMNKLSVLGIEH